MSGDLALPDLAEQINTAHDQAHRAARTAIEHAIECGRLLLEAKTSVAHGGWLPWVEASLSFGDRQAQKYMRLSKFMVGKSELLNSHLTLDGALAAIAEPKPQKPRAPQKPNWEPANPAPPVASEPKPSEASIADEPKLRPAEPEPEEFSSPPPGRPRLDLDALEEVKRQYLELNNVDRNAFAHWALEHQLQQTDLTPRHKASLRRVLEVLTAYGGGGS